MKIRQARFSVPDCITAEPMPAKAFKLLVYLFSLSEFAGGCRPGYEQMRYAMRAKDGENGCNNTIRRQLLYLKKKGWIFEMRKTNARMRIWLQIPARLRIIKNEDENNRPISVVSL